MTGAQKAKLRGRLSSAALALALCTLAACGSSGDAGRGTAGDPSATFDAAPFATATSDSGRLHVEARSAPEPTPTRGVNEVELAISDASGAPVEGLAIDVVLWMSAMGHGASVKPTVAARGGGRYAVTNVDFFMPGRWEIRATISAPFEDHALLVAPVQ